MKNVLDKVKISIIIKIYIQRERDHSRIVDGTVTASGLGFPESDCKIVASSCDNHGRLTHFARFIILTRIFVIEEENFVKYDLCAKFQTEASYIC